MRLATQRLLGNERVGADRTGVDLVVDKVVQLQHVLVADRDLTIERFTRAAVVDAHLARAVEACSLQHIDDVGFLGAVEHRRCDRNALLVAWRLRVPDRRHRPKA